MTVDECAKVLIRAVMAAWCENTSPDKLIENVTAQVRGLILTESERAAGVCLQIATETSNSDVGGRFAKWAAGKCHDEILRTSPGKGRKAKT
jgi:hypothetical protein